MSDPKAMMTTAQFAKKAGVSTSTVSKWIRSGKVEGTKQGGKWVISEDQLEKMTDASSGPAKPNGASASKSAAPPVTKKSDGPAHSVEAFSNLTYLTPFGVERYLKEGKLTGKMNSSGQWEVDASNLERKEIKHLVR